MSRDLTETKNPGPYLNGSVDGGNLYYIYRASKSKSKSVLVSGTHLGPTTNFSHYLLGYLFRQFRVCWCGAPSLTRSRISTFQFLPGIASAAFLRSECHGTHEHSSLYLFLRLLQPGGPGVYMRILELEFFLRPTVSRPVRLDIRPPFGRPLTRFYLALLFSVWQLRYSSFKAPSLTRKRVCSLQCNHSLVQ
jgi:hypothetical protein